MTIVGDVATIPAGYEHIAVAVAGSAFFEAAVRGSDLLATASEAELHLVHVNPGRNAVERHMRVLLAGRVGAIVPAHRLEWLEGDMLDPAAAINAYLSSMRLGVGSVACHGYRGADLLVGSVTEDLLLAGRPVLLHGPSSSPARPRRVAVCVDGSEWSASIVPEAARWAAALDLPLRFVQGVDGDPAAGRPLDANRVDELALQWRSTGLDTGWELVHDGRNGRRLAAWLNEVPGTLTVAATRGRSGLARGGLGGVANQLVRHTKGPMVLQRFT